MSGDTSCCTMTIHFTLLCCDYVLVHGIMENPFFFFCGIEIGIENRVILLVLVPTTEFLVS